MMRLGLLPCALMVSLVCGGASVSADEEQPAADKAVKPLPEGTQKALDQSSLVDRLARENALMWQKAVAAYKSTAKKARRAVVRTDFDEARRLADVARQTIESSRRYASDVAEYERYGQQAKDLLSFVADEKRHHEERLIQKQHQEIEERNRARVALVQRTRQQQIDQLMQQAEELRKQHRLDETIQVLDQVLTIDPTHDSAKWKRETLGDWMSNRRDRQAVSDRWVQAQSLLVTNDETGIPYHEDLRYPPNWPEISARRGAVSEAGESRETVQVRRELQKTAPEIKFDALPFEEVIDQLRNQTGLNIVPNWSALEAAFIERDAEVSLRLKNVKFEKVMELILDEVGAGEVDLAYEISGGIVSISTKDDLSRRTVAKVYDVQDLLLTVPTFRGREINLDDIGENDQEGGLGGGRFLLGGGGQGGGSGQGLFEDSGQDDENDTDQLNPIQPIIDLIQATIDPASWRSAGGNVGSISPLNQQIIVTQTSTAHDELRDLLRE